MRTLSLAVWLTLGLVSSSLAQGVSNQNTNQQGQNQSAGSIRQQVLSNLQNSGYTDIKIMPQSFLVRAKDRDGNPVMMVINPDSITAITEFNSGRGSSTTGSASGRSPSDNTGGNAPNAPSNGDNSPTAPQNSPGGQNQNR
jgi:hypothetical protein